LIVVRAIDNAGNFKEGMIYAKIDRTPPAPLLLNVTPSGWSRTMPDIDFSTTDNTSGIDHYELGVDGGDFAIITSPYSLPALVDGIHTVTVRAFDIAGNRVEGNASVFIDASAPMNVSVGMTSGKKSTATRAISLAIHASDAYSGLDSMCFSNDGLVYSAWENFSPLKNWTLSPSAGDKTVYLKVRDRAGNEADPVSTLVGYGKAQNGKTNLSIALVVIIAVAVVAGFAAYGYRKLRRKKT
jgi:hypothetical protein